MKKTFLLCAGILAGFVSSGSISSQALAQDISGASYPIAELGNCASQDECRAYCDVPDNHLACIGWGKQQGVFSSMEAKRMADMVTMENAPNDPVAGPGGCQSPQSCDAYCRVLENLEECLQYGEQHGYISANDAQKAREKAAKGGPGSCQSREECDSFCRNPENMKTCMQFVVEEGKITQEEADLMIEIAKNKDFGKPKGPEINKQKAIEVLEEKGGGPGGCKTPDECRAYCEGTVHAQECLDYASQNGLMSSEEAEKVMKMMSMGGPGGCKNEKECDEFCRQEENRDTCFNFSKESGMLSPEEIMMMEKQMTIIKKLEGGRQSGPGGCKSAQECSAYCSDPSRIKECMEFSAQTGIMSKEQAQTMVQQFDQAQQMQQFFMMGPQPGMTPQAVPGMPQTSPIAPQDYQGQMPPMEAGTPMPFQPHGTMMGPPQGMTPPPDYQNQNQNQYQYQGPPPESQQGPSLEFAPPQEPEPSGVKRSLLFMGNVLFSLFKFLR